jgi:hypothetical protein
MWYDLSDLFPLRLEICAIPEIDRGQETTDVPKMVRSSRPTASNQYGEMGRITIPDSGWII